MGARENGGRRCEKSTCKGQLTCYNDIRKAHEMKIKVRYFGYLTIMDEDGNFGCPHEELEFSYDEGGDGITEPGASWGVFCWECQNDDMSQNDVDRLIENHIAEMQDLIDWSDDNE